MHTPPNSTRRIHTGALSGAMVLVLIAGTQLGGCGERLRRNKHKNQQQTAAEVNAGLGNIARDNDPVEPGDQPEDPGMDETRRRVIESANLLDEYFADASKQTDPPADTPTNQPANEPTQTTPPQTSVAAAAPTQPPESTPEPADDADGVRFSLGNSAPAGTPPTAEQPPKQPAKKPADTAKSPDAQPETSPTEPEPAEPIDPELRKEQLVDELVGVLTGLAQNADDPGAPALALAGLETLRPDTVDGLIEQGLLSEAEVASLEAVREMLRGMANTSGLGPSIAGPSQVAEMLERIQRELNAQAGLHLRNAQLCVRVLGYGQFDPFPSYAFTAGRAHRVIVYVEVDRFAQRESQGSDGDPRFEVELSQRLELYDVADDLNIWNRAAETDKTASRNRLRDYYLINQIVLPPNLGVGRYHLKIVMRDLISGQSAETIIPIEIVAG